MKTLLNRISIQVNDQIYLKDPESSELGKNIIGGSIVLINELGFEDFTFKKLADSIGSTEASLYRYFKSKHKLLLYLCSWYWGWIEYKLVFSLANVDSAVDRLDKAILVLAGPVKDDNAFEHINETKLHDIVICESSKAYMHKMVDEENQQGVFAGYKQLVGRVSDIITEIRPGFKYPHMLVSTVIEGSHHQRYFAEHLPKLTDTVKGEDSITHFYSDLVRKTLGIN